MLNAHTSGIVRDQIRQLQSIQPLGVQIPTTLRINPFAYHFSSSLHQIFYNSLYITIVGPRASAYEGKLYDLMFIFDNGFPDHEPLIQFVPQQYTGDIPAHEAYISFLFLSCIYSYSIYIRMAISASSLYIVKVGKRIQQSQMQLNLLFTSFKHKRKPASLVMIISTVIRIAKIHVTNSGSYMANNCFHMVRYLCCHSIVL